MTVVGKPLKFGCVLCSTTPIKQQQHNHHIMTQIGNYLQRRRRTLSSEMREKKGTLNVHNPCLREQSLLHRKFLASLPTWLLQPFFSLQISSLPSFISVPHSLPISFLLFFFFNIYHLYLNIKDSSK